MTTKRTHDNPILVTGAAGAVGGIGHSLIAEQFVRDFRRMSLSLMEIAVDHTSGQWARLHPTGGVSS